MAQQETEHLTRIMISAALSRAVSSIAELGVADLISAGQPQPVEYLASATKTHEPSLYRILRFMAGHGLFRETGNRHFDHTPLSAALRSDAPGSYRAAAQLFHHIFAAWDGLDHSIHTGEPGFTKVFGAPVFNYIPMHPELGPVFDAGMTSMNFYETSAMLDAYDFSGISVLADIGGGNGSLISAVLARYPEMTGMLFDLGHVVGRAQENLKATGLADRCSAVLILNIEIGQGQSDRSASRARMFVAADQAEQLRLGARSIAAAPMDAFVDFLKPQARAGDMHTGVGGRAGEARDGLCRGVEGLEQTDALVW